MRGNKKPLIIGTLCTLVVIMAVGFALLSENLNITGTSNINSNWNIKITNIEKKSQSGTPTETTSPTYTDTTASFNVGFTTPGDSITYTITITNSGNLDGVLERVKLNCTKNEAIECNKSGLTRGDTISKNGGTNTLDITITYNSATTTQPTNTNSKITATIDYVQNLGQEIITYDTYRIGDIVEYPDSNTKWYVIKDSEDDEDYVTLLKQNVLTNVELGEYSDNNSNVMAYYWSPTCHKANHGYTEVDTTGCTGHSDYDGSKVKEFLDNVYVNMIGTSNLKTVNGYMIRIITRDELKDNLGWISDDAMDFGNSVAEWVYDFGAKYYWTMTESNSVRVYYVNKTGVINHDHVTSRNSVRPVINLYKSAINQ